jgi:hypothetical protein
MFEVSEVFSGLQEKLLTWNVFNKTKILLQCFYFYLAFIGIFGFALFIAEETQQINMWAIFAASDSNRTDLILKNCQVIDEINQGSKFINKWFMWINPFQKWSYSALNDGVDVYLETQRAYVLSKSPELYIGKNIELDFRYKSYKPGKNNLFILKNKKVKIITSKLPEGPVTHINGIVQPDPEVTGGVIIINNL